MTRARTLADMISDGVIGTTELADDVITPVKLDETGSYTMAQLGVNGTVTADGLTVETISEGAAPSNTPSDYDLAIPAANTDGYYGHNLGFYSGATPTVRASINSRDDGSGGAVGLTFHTGSGSTTDERLRISSGGDISFYDTSGNAKFFWDAADERLGIGTSLPTTALTVSTDGTEQLTINRADASINTGNTVGTILFTGDDPSANQTGARIQVLASQNWSSNAYGSHITFSNDSSGTLTERMRLDSSGDMLLGPAAAGTTQRLFAGTGTSAGQGLAGFVWSYDDRSTLGLQIRTDETFSSSYPITFSTTGSSDMKLDTSGNLLVGGTSVSPATDDVAGIKLSATGAIQASVDGNAALFVNRKGAGDGTLVDFRHQGAQVGTIGVAASGADFYVSGSGSASGVYFNANGVLPALGGSPSDNTEDLGQPDLRFKDLYLSGTIEIENGSGNVGVGRQALNSNTGDGNTALGFQSSYSLTSGTDQVSVGARSGYSNQTSTDNTFIGNQAGYATTGGGNTFVGVTRGGGSYGAGRYVTTGSKNTIIGGYDGNQDGIDIRTRDKHVVLSDGDGDPQFHTWYETTDSINQMQASVPRGLMLSNGNADQGLTSMITVNDNSNTSRARFAVSSVTSQFDTGHIFVTMSGIDGGASDNRAAWYFIKFAVYNRGVSYIGVVDSGGDTTNTSITVTDQGDSSLGSNGIVLQVSGATQSGNATFIMNVTLSNYRGIHAAWRN